MQSCNKFALMLWKALCFNKEYPLYAKASFSSHPTMMLPAAIGGVRKLLFA